MRISSFGLAVLLVLSIAYPPGGAGAEAGTPARAQQGGKEKAPMLGVGHFQIPDWFWTSFLDLPEDLAQATAEGKRLMIMFHQDGCPYCAKLVNHNFSQRPIVDYLRRHFMPIEINMWGSREVVDLDGEELDEAALAKKYKVWFTPSVLFLDEQGKVVFRMNGYYPPEKFMLVLRYVGEHREQAMAFPAYYRQQAGPATEPQGVAGLHHEPYFAKPPYGLNQGKPLAVLFEQTDCPDCDALHKGPLQDPETLRYLQGFKVVQLNRWSRQPLVDPQGEHTTARQWADALGIGYLPALVLFDQGQEVIRAESLFKSFHLQSMMDYVLSGAYKRQPEFQRYVHQRADTLREQGVAVDLWD